MSERQPLVELVVVAAAVTRLRHVSRQLEVLEDLRRGPFGDADADGDVADPLSGIRGDALQDLRVVRDEPPAMLITGI